jgi:hypothetical protein
MQQFRREQSSMRLFVRPEFRQSTSQFGVTPPARQLLTSIDIDGAMLARMVDLQDTIPDRFTGM